MGIKNLNQFVKKTIKEKEIDEKLIFKTEDFSSLSGYRVAFDANIWAKTNMFTAIKAVVEPCDIVKLIQSTTSVKPREIIPKKDILSKWLGKMIEDISIFLYHNSLPLFVFDGEYPDEKLQTKTDRKDDVNKAKEKLVDLINKIRNGDPLDISSTDIIECKKLFCRMNFVGQQDYITMKETLYYIGIPFIQAKGEAEKLCTALCIDGYAKAVYSTDTDNIVYGCPFLITSYNRYNIDCVSISTVLNVLEMEFKTFIDLCIMAKCDYNENIPNLAIGRAYKLLMDYGSIEKVIESGKIGDEAKYGCLRFERCRKLFTIKSASDNIEEGYYDLIKEHINSSNLVDYCNHVGILSNVVDRYKRFASNFTVVKTLKKRDPYSIKIY